MFYRTSDKMHLYSVWLHYYYTRFGAFWAIITSNCSSFRYKTYQEVKYITIHANIN
jgi:hypothetical protein